MQVREAAIKNPSLLFGYGKSSGLLVISSVFWWYGKMMVFLSQKNIRIKQKFLNIKNMLRAIVISALIFSFAPCYSRTLTVHNHSWLYIVSFDNDLNGDSRWHSGNFPVWQDRTANIDSWNTVRINSTRDPFHGNESTGLMIKGLWVSFGFSPDNRCPNRTDNIDVYVKDPNSDPFSRGVEVYCVKP